MSNIIANNRSSPLWKRIVVTLAICAAAALIDQASKTYILDVVMQPPRIIPVTPFFNLTLGFNTGVSFGIGRDFFDEYPLMLTGFKVMIASGMLIWAALSANSWERAGLALMAGGALGNAIDRWRQGAVTDFLDFYWRDYHWPTFNMADVLIALGVAVFFWPPCGLEIRTRKRLNKRLRAILYH